MKTFNRYIGLQVAKGYMVVLAILLTVFSFLAFVEELENIGEGQYRLVDAAQYVLLMVPRNIVELMPVTALLGSLLALGSLASGNELLAMQAVGISALRMSWLVIRWGLVLILAVVGLDEFVAPPLEQQALAHRTLKTGDLGLQQTAHGFWARDENRFLHVGKMLHGRIPSEIDIFKFDEDGRLEQYIHAGQARSTPDKQWVLIDVQQKDINDQGIHMHNHNRLPWKSFVNQDQIDLLLLPPESLSLSDLNGYIEYLMESDQNAERYALALWKKIGMPIAVGAMVLLAIPFVLGPLRQITMGQRIIAGAIIGLSFHLFSQILGQLGLLFSIHPAITALVPSIVVLSSAIWLLRRATV